MRAALQQKIRTMRQYTVALKTRKESLERTLREGKLQRVRQEKQIQSLEENCDKVFSISAILGTAAAVVDSSLFLARANNREASRRVTEETATRDGLKARHDALVGELGPLPDVVEERTRYIAELQAELARQNEQLEALKAYVGVRKGDVELARLGTEYACMRTAERQARLTEQFAQATLAINAAYDGLQDAHLRLESAEHRENQLAIAIQNRELGEAQELDAAVPVFGGPYAWPSQHVVSTKSLSLGSTPATGELATFKFADLHINTTPAAGLSSLGVFQLMAMPFSRGSIGQHTMEPWRSGPWLPSGSTWSVGWTLIRCTSTK